MTAPPRPGGLMPPHAGPLPEARSGAGGVRVVGSVRYAGVPGFRPLEMDLYLPPEGFGRPVPAVVFLHGGGWLVGSRNAAGPAFAGASPTPFERVALAGIAVASIDYRLSGEATWPAALHDAKAAVRWLRTRGPEAGLDPTRIAAWGESAGGHLAALLGLTSDFEGGVGITGVSSAVKTVVCWYAPSDLATVPTDPDAPDSREALFLGAPVSAVPERAAEASPITYAGEHAPPFLLLHGTADRLVPAQQSRRLADALPNVELELFEDADHMWLGTPEVAETALNRTIDFLRHHL
ncbi:alpha/beta hydrolase fold domain-containing protein [Cryptosporangium sp. NPDC048952]|uniref:alpha/beta hydrolase fold domain-containing protein n=1 Tax=Cryptosporangium sp. NPDC048952 TaxID=3363961 RepID=UPI003710BE45